EVQATVIPGSEFGDGVGDLLDTMGIRRLPWERAVRSSFDLAVAGSANGDLHRVKAPVMLFSHGAGFHKLLPFSVSGTGLSDLAAARIMHSGKVVPARIMLPGRDSLHRLRDDCPQAEPRARIAGDPALQQLRAHAPLRGAYRSALGLRPGQRLVVVSSTWGTGSLAGQSFELVERLCAELPLDEYRVALILHPNIEAYHGRHGVKSRVRKSIDSGLIRIPSQSGWQATVLAADCVIGDHGSVTFYGADFVPVAVAAHSPHEYLADGPLAAFADVVPHFDVDRPVLPQVESLLAQPRSEAARPVIDSSIERDIDAAGVFRSTMYELMRLEEPAAPSFNPLPLPAPRCAEVLAALVHTKVHESSVAVTRYPAATAATGEGMHLVARVDAANPRVRQSAAALITDDRDTPLEDVLRAHPGCRLAARRLTSRSSEVRHRDGSTVLATTDGRVRVDPAWLAVSVCYALGTSFGQLPGRVDVTVGGGHTEIRFDEPSLG
ncbi:MAG: hypothetical protein ACRD0P_09725, partial [Stackebrandtia sp.]